jgi:hypothetical protein
MAGGMAQAGKLLMLLALRVRYVCHRHVFPVLILINAKAAAWHCTAFCVRNSMRLGPGHSSSEFEQ